MRWIHPKPTRPQGASIALLRQAVAAFPGHIEPYVRLGQALARRKFFAEAVMILEDALARAPGAFPAWRMLASCCLGLGRPENALAICARAPDPFAVAAEHGLALCELGRVSEARNVWRRAVDARPFAIAPATELLRSLAGDEDGAPLLETCDALGPALARIPLARAYRAIAYSRLGRVEEARALVDLDRHVARLTIPTPPKFESLAAFNRALADEILADPSPDNAERDGTEIRYDRPPARSPAFAALEEAIRIAMLDFVGTFDARGLSGVMPPLPPTGHLHSANTVLRDSGRNGEHIHAMGYVSAVYYVQVPPVDASAGAHRGDLVLGLAPNRLNGYEPCWGRRTIAPEEGTLVLFPSHVFHDVVPTRVTTPRISVASDLMPVWPGAEDNP